MSDPNSFSSFVDVHLTDDQDELKSHSAVVCLAQPGVPVVFVSDAFEAHTGYRQDEVIGRSLSLLQGADTEPEAVGRFRQIISNGQSGTVRITNYRKDGTRFLHECELRPVRDQADNVTHIIAIQRPVPAASPDTKRS